MNTLFAWQQNWPRWAFRSLSPLCQCVESEKARGTGENNNLGIKMFCSFLHSRRSFYYYILSISVFGQLYLKNVLVLVNIKYLILLASICLPLDYLCHHLMLTFTKFTFKSTNHLITLLNVIFSKSQNAY